VEIPTNPLVLAYPVHNTLVGNFDCRLNSIHMTKSRYKGAMHNQRLTNLRIAFGLAGVSFTDHYTLELVIRVIDGVEELKGDFSVRDASKIAAEVESLRKRDEKKNKKPVT
jgi:hypothetical protein